MTLLSKADLKKRVDAAQGRIPCDLLLKRARFLDVFSCEWRTGDIAIVDGVIVGTESGLKATREIDLKGKTIVPGFIDAHVHVESSMMVPSYFQQAILPRGTTTAICDPHEIANVIGVKGIEMFLDAADDLTLDLRVMLSSCVPATHLETNGGGTLAASDLLPLARRKKALGLAEVMNMPGVLNSDPNVHEKLEAFQGKPIDGHSPLLRGNALSAYLATGISSCHESSQYDEAEEKVSKGMSVWIREGSVAKDLETLAPLLNIQRSTSMGFCTDDRNPYDIAKEGHIDHLIRGSIAKGVDEKIAYRTASWSVARHYGLTLGAHRTGAVAPGYQADLVILDDARSCAVSAVLKSGRWVSEMQFKTSAASSFVNTIQAEIPDERDLLGTIGNVHVIGVEHGKILTDRSVESSDARGVARLSVLERYGHGSKPANAYVRGFGDNFEGAIASSVGHDSHNLIAAGKHSKDMKIAMAALIRSGGGFAVAKDGKVLAQIDLPFAGLMSTRSPEELTAGIVKLKEASRSIGCELPEPFLQLAFLSLPVIPSLKLTDKGLVDVEKFEVIDVRAS